MKNMGSILNIQHYEEDILLINKSNNLNFLHYESSHWGKTVLKYFKQENNFIF